MRSQSLHAVLASVGRRIAELRERKGWTQERLAERLDVATRNLQAIERGKRNLTIATLQKLATVLRVELGEFFVAPTSPKRGPGRPRHVSVAPSDAESRRKSTPRSKRRG